MKPIYIELVDHGVANRFELPDYEVIEVNWRLNQYPELYSRILKHEMGHDDGKYKFKDLYHDMLSRTPGLFRFMFNNISSWTQLLPIYYSKRKHQFVYDISSLVSFVTILIIAVFTYRVMVVL